MRTLLRGTTAYKIFARDCASGRASHAYMLYFRDGANLRLALKYFALVLFGADEKSREGSLIMSESFSDVKIYPAEGKLPSVADADEIFSDSAMQPLEGDRKAYVFSDFDKASAIVQNKLLKVLEEPPAGVYFLLGATSLAPVLQTVRSRVRVLEIEPFSQRDIYAALLRQFGENPLNAPASESCGGDFGQAQAMVTGGWFKDILAAATEISRADRLSAAGDLSIKYADVKEKGELLRQLQRIYFGELKKSLSGGQTSFCRAALIYASEAVGGALEDLKFNASFGPLLYDLMSGIIMENDKWKKLLV